MLVKWSGRSKVRRLKRRRSTADIYMKRTAKKIRDRIQRHRRIRARVFGTAERPRLAFFRSNKHLYAQIIDDTSGRTLVGISSASGGEKRKADRARQMGTDLANQAKECSVTKVVFDRGGFMYAGSVKIFADAVRQGGLEF